MSFSPLITRIDRYVFRQLTLALIAVTGGLAMLIWLTQSLRFVELVVNRGLSFAVFLQLTGLLIPSFVAVILPITTFVVVQFVYQRLSGDRELTVMRAAGISPFGLSRPALGVAGLAVVACYLLNLWIVPAALFSFREFQWEIRNRLAAFLLQEGVFTQISDDLTVYVRIREPDGTLRGILVDDRRQKSAQATILAESGQLLDGPNGPRVLLLNGSRQEIDRQTGRLNMLLFGENTIDLAQTSKGEAARQRDNAEVSLSELLNPPPGTVSARDIPRWRVEGHKRIATPLTTLSYALIALVASLTGAFSRHGSIVRPVLAIATVVGLLATGLAVGNLAARNVSLIPLLWVHAIAPGVIAAWILFGPRLIAARRPPAAEPDAVPAAVDGARPV
jgi:lipopolysaccharide export system permease protein